MPPYRKVQVRELSSDFHWATEIVTEPELPVPSAGNVIVKNHYVGINATDVNVTAATTAAHLYRSAVVWKRVLDAHTLQFGVVVAVGEGVTTVSVNDTVTYRKGGAFIEFLEVSAASLLKTPEASPRMLPLTICGVSATLALKKVGQLGTNETVFVTAAAGGTGQFVVQLAKLAGNHVIGTCSSEEKTEYLKSLGVDRVINYSKEDIGTVLKTEYPNGLDLVFESVGGDIFKTVLENIAVHGRTRLFGAVSGYQGAKVENPLLSPDVNRTIQRKSVSLRGFFMPNFAQFVPEYIEKLLALIHEGKLTVGIDPTEFKGLEEIADAIDRLFAKKNIGKLVVKIVD